MRGGLGLKTASVVSCKEYERVKLKRPMSLAHVVEGLCIGKLTLVGLRMYVDQSKISLRTILSLFCSEFMVHEFFATISPYSTRESASMHCLCCTDHSAKPTDAHECLVTLRGHYRVSHALCSATGDVRLRIVSSSIH